jgi:hypothetical protein
MNHYISGIIKLALLEGAVALLLIDLVAAGKYARARAQAGAVLAGLMVFAWANYGALRPNTSIGYVLLALPLVLACAWLVQAGFGDTFTDRMKAFRARTASFGGPKVASLALAAALAFGWVGQGLRTNSLDLVHPWEQFHFYLGAKYQREVGWFNLYKAALLADRESAHALDGVKTTRDLTTFDEVSVDVALQDQAQVRARFSNQRWEDFKADWATFTRVFPIDWTRVLNDHGNSNSPAWAILAYPLASLAPISLQSNSWLGWLDLLLMLALWLAVWQTFGPRVSAMGLLVWAAPPNVFNYLSGSFLRWDWLFATGLAAVFLKRGRYVVAGAFFGYAVASKLFPIFFGVALGLRALDEYRRTRTFRVEYRQFVIATVASGAACVGLAALMFGPDAWLEYAQRIQVAQVEKFYAIQYSLKTVWLQYAAGSWPVWAQGLFPAELMQARADVNLNDYALGLFAVRLVFTALIAQLIRRADDVEAFLLGPLLVFTWLTVNMYYWNMLGLLALGLMLRSDRQRPALALLIGLLAIFGCFYLYQHFNRGLTEGFMVATLLAGLIVGTSLWELRDAKRATA